MKLFCTNRNANVTSLFVSSSSSPHSSIGRHSSAVLFSLGSTRLCRSHSTMADEPSIPMDQEEEDNDEYFSAKESPSRKLSQECLKSSTPRSERAGPESSPSSRKSTSSGKSDRPQFFSDEAAMQGSENSSTKKSEKVRRLKDKKCWDMREYKKEELDGPVKQKKKPKKKSKNKKKEEVVEKSKTDEESGEEKEDPSSPLPQSEGETPQPRPFFQSQKLILQVKSDKPIAPKCKFRVLRFAKTQEVVEYDSQGEQHLLDHYNERAISNPWRRWGAHRALCDQGGYLVDKNKKLVEIKRGSDPPKCPPNPRQVTLNKNCEAPDSQTMMGTLRVEVGPAEDEVHRIGKLMEDYVLKNGGFVPPPMTRKEMQARPTKGQPMVVVQTKGVRGYRSLAPIQIIDFQGVMRESSAVRKGKKSKPARTPKKSSGSDSRSGEESEENTEEGDSTAEKVKKPREAQPPSNPPPAPPQPMENSRKGGGIGGFLKSTQEGPIPTEEQEQGQKQQGKRPIGNCIPTGSMIGDHSILSQLLTDL
ncbi:hypothetical protein PRIPAC_93150 [Pristionchus pacificus]|uniref:Uncharacterized protein n=1 Tax=Pristionchus pacificus TaxID=54126 RepID=A0A2A6CIB7_PRIPA|nr:hypothetical protein PRIPAC_93150 [Pristionchus pacificus]|eukprot:PDM77761.1 hypothetical protein PRIPAC_34628 [Pristionchus pacificus]